MELVQAILVPALAALLGAWAGAHVALDRFKQERAYERRLEWHLEALRIIQRLDRLRAQVSRSDATPDEAYASAAEDFYRIVSESAAFMARSQWRALRITRLRYQEAVRQTEAFLRDGEEPDLIGQALAAESGCLDDAEEQVLKNVHKLLPPEPDASTWQRFRSWLRSWRRRAGLMRR